VETHRPGSIPAEKRGKKERKIQVVVQSPVVKRATPRKMVAIPRDVTRSEEKQELQRTAIFTFPKITERNY
jgi:hypothetical protein